MAYEDQIERIRRKLKKAKRTDWQRKVFGSASHQYKIGPPVPINEVALFEQKYDINLPECYRAFVTQLGNGGSSYCNSGAGPYYGIYPFGEQITELDSNPAMALRNPCIVSPDTPNEEWTSHFDVLYDDQNLSDDDFEQENARVFGGLLPIGSQGCSYLHALVINGPCSGRVVNIELEVGKPQFAFEANFLDWYERWLDEISLGYLSQGAAWFGRTMGGDAEHLVKTFREADTRQLKLDALDGFIKLISIGDASIEFLQEKSADEDDEIRRISMQMLAKFAYKLARPTIKLHIASNDDDCQAACQAIRWYGKKHVREWILDLKARVAKTEDVETLQWAVNLLADARVDYRDEILPYCNHEDESYRRYAYYSLGRLRRKRDLTDQFLLGLRDSSSEVVHASLQAIAGVKDKRFLPAYCEIIDRFKTDENWILTNLKHRLKEHGFSSIEQFRNRRSQ